MVRKKLKDLYCVDTISQDKGWKKLQDAIAEFEEDIVIDFNNINVVDPWQCVEFKQLLRNPHVYMEFVNSEAMVNRIKMMCIIDGLDESRIKNVVVELPREKTPEEKKIEHYGMELIPYFDIDNNGVATLELSKKYSQIQSTNTLGYIDYAIREIHNVQMVDKFLLKMGKLVVLPNVMQIIANMIVQYEMEGFHLLVDCDDEETYKNMALFIHNATAKEYKYEARVNAIKKQLENNTPGMLIKYKKSKAKDEFGREGKGEIVSSRIAIFKKLKPTGNKVKSGEKDENGKDILTDEYLFVVETFNNEYFYTKEHWMVEHDNEEPTSLHSDTLELSMEEIGLCDSYLGSKYHFILPIQQEERENQVVIIGFDEEERNIKKMCTIPERMKYVFDSWEVEYNADSLDKSILDSKNEIEKRKNGTSHLDGVCEPFSA